jgi:addiction module RelE/StbE family toxin
VAEVDWAVDARADLAVIQDYVEAHSPEASRRLVDRFLLAIRRLESFPHLGRIVPEFENDGIRELIVASYRVVYYVQQQRVTIVAIVHGARDLQMVAEERAWSF